VIYQFGQINTAGALAPGVDVQIVAPPAVVQGASTSGYGLVGVASWGPVNSPLLTGSPQANAMNWGNQTVRMHDLATAIAVAFQLGQSNNIAVRVSDGTDTAATAQLLDGSAVNGATITGMYTGVLGNQLVATVGAGTQANSSKLTLALPGFSGEVYDNLAQGVASGTVTAGTGFTSTPTVSISAPQAANGQQATGSVSLKVITATKSNAGSGYVTGDTITLQNGVILTVTATAGAITALTVTNAGNIAGGAAPTNPVAQLSTSGVGVGATVTLVWGLGVFTPGVIGSGYTSATATLNGGGGTGGAIALTTSVWPNLVSAVNNGQSGVRGPSQIAIATIGTSAAVPALASYTLSGGTDGAAGVTDTTLLGSNTAPPTGMYCHQSTNVQTLNLVDHQTSSQWSAIGAFCLLNGIFGGGNGTPGQTIASTAAALNTAGVDNYCFKDLTGDWVYWQDTVNNVQRMLAPMTIWAPMRANMAPNQSTLNKPVNGIIGTIRSAANQPYSDAELLAACNGRVDMLANPSAGGNYFSFQTDRNTSSQAATNSEAYTTMTNFLALTLAANYGFAIGNPQTGDLRKDITDSLSAFLTGLWKVSKYIGNVNAPSAIPFKITLNASNNPNSQVALGVMSALVQVTYLSIVRTFLISLQGGSSVQVTVQ
jgi:hypothetical protein